MDFTRTLLDGIKVWAENKFTRLNKELSMKQPIGDYVLKDEIPELDFGFATEDYVNAKVADLVNSAPETLDTLNELAQALGEDPNFATTIATQIGILENKINNKNIEIATDEEIIELLLSCDIMPIVVDNEGNIITDENNFILLV